MKEVKSYRLLNANDKVLGTDEFLLEDGKWHVIEETDKWLVGRGWRDLMVPFRREILAEEIVQEPRGKFRLFRDKENRTIIWAENEWGETAPERDDALLQDALDLLTCLLNFDALDFSYKNWSLVSASVMRRAKEIVDRG